MRNILKPLNRQVIVITGATSGIGLATARMAAKAGARVVLAARSEQALGQLVEEIGRGGGSAVAVIVDVAEEASAATISAKAKEVFGGFDTWVNNAGLGIFGRLEQVSDEPHHRLFEVNFWGLVYGTQIASAHLGRRGGAIVNLGSVASDVAFPVQGMYCASKHAIKGFTDAFRMELEEAHAPISLTLIKPASIDTPFPIHARNYLDEEPTLPPPVYQPEDVAGAILYAAEHGGRDYYVGGGGKLMSSLNKHAPAAIDWIGSRMARMESSGPPSRPREGSLHAVAVDGEVHGRPTLMVRRSGYTSPQTHPLSTVAVLTIAGVAALALFATANRD